ncbi:Uncharacterised protein [Mycobacteroides abscessus subsp. massiliense]|uniref:hypothetical protein n=1 Tax=Mycobacteroides abscessus TaxID=36809 RepID=UPI0009286543|nr:hypothetical protein [Mycobacteroides abscessus]SHX42868.1 Uncharacterised protein [Mycobacteroides abscessus subsp. abscessus]SKM69057.1 Uncharacterised protein [Mycobacteroides abscessus subsp. massiliense]SKN34907.1 Uncharacterised protein [Mycobacteroides abscessus subsp. massiliense]SKP16809.1 Uncharacterised protein [Mycobacteroides abscessus subsp. massiliense]SKP56390.1 Uncharacterised protein [Mycobacteroides abscessus subsp. massiliense]
MSPRWFVGLVGTALIALSIGLWMGYDMTATSSGHTVACGTLQHPTNPGFGDAYRWVMRGDGEPNDYNAACADKREPFKLAAYALGGTGVLTILGAIGIRSRSDKANA